MKKMYRPGECPKESGLYHLVNLIEKTVETTVAKVVVYVGPQQTLPVVEHEHHVWMKA